MNKLFVMVVFVLALVLSSVAGEVVFAPNATAQDAENLNDTATNSPESEVNKSGSEEKPSVTASGESQSENGEGANSKHTSVQDKNQVNELAATPAVPPAKKYKFYRDIREIEDLEEGSEEDFDESLENSNVKVVYKTPDSCKEFTLYLDNKARKLERKEMELKKREQELELMQERFEKLAANYTDTENRIKQIMQKDPTDLKGNPELSKMVKLFETFSPEEAAARLQNLDLDLTLAILKGVKPKTLSKIMAAMDPKLSAALSSQMVRGF